VTAREADLPPVRVADRSLEISLLVEAREDLVTEMARVRNRLHADLRVLVPGYGERAANLVAVRHQRVAAGLLRRLTDIQAELARTRLARLRALADEERALAARIGAMVAGHPLLELPGAGALVTAKLLGEIGPDEPDAAQPGRQPSAQPGIPHHRPRPGSAHPPAKEYIERKRSEGKTHREALRALKRQLVRTVFRLLQEGAASARMAA